MAKKKFNEQETEDRDEAKRDMKMWMANGWDLTEETPEFFLLKRSTATLGGHVLVFFITFWFTFGLGNLVYWLLSKEKKKVIK